MPKILFICTANYYRSRFAEAVFNQLADRKGSSWTAFSRGLIPEEAPPGLSPHAKNGLRLAGIDPKFVAKDKQALTARDFDEADRIVALKRDEHLPMLQERYPEQVDRIEFWDVSDVPHISPPQAMLAIKESVQKLLEEIQETEKENSSR